MHAAVETGRIEGFRLSFIARVKARSEPIVMHPAVFLGGFVTVGMLFALQTWISSRMWNGEHKVDLNMLFMAWGAQYLIWGVICWLLWFFLSTRIQRATLPQILAIGLPLSVVVSFAEEMIWVFCFPNLPVGKVPMPYWQRLEYQLDYELIDSMVIFWFFFFLIRGVGYYQKYREKEYVARQLEVQLAHAQIKALRMQLNPHFLFNTLNGISSLMHSDVAAADTMLEQLGSLLRITLERGDIQLIPLADEMEFVEMYMAVQNRRFADRMTQQIEVEPDLHDALVPAMILQPIIENAYSHGISHLACGGLLLVSAKRDGVNLSLTVLNTGPAMGTRLDGSSHPGSTGNGVGLKNVQSRLQLHYGNDHKMTMQAVAPGRVLVAITIPLELSTGEPNRLKGYGVL